MIESRPTVFMDWDPCNPDPWSVVTWVWADDGDRLRIQSELGAHFEHDPRQGMIFDPVEVARLG